MFAINKNGGINIVLLLTLFALISTVGRAGIDYIPTYQLTFMSDIDEVVMGQSREGIYTGANSFFSKIATAVQGAVLGMGLAMFGFQLGACNNSTSISYNKYNNSGSSVPSGIIRNKFYSFFTT